MATNRTRGSAAHKRCFVTIGATAPFDKLIQAIFAPPFLQALSDAKYTELRIQHGKEGQAIFDANLKAAESRSDRLHISGFDFDKKGLSGEMLAARGSPSKDPSVADPSEGLIISHAGMSRHQSQVI